jgi:hypothetical protein
VLSSCLTLSYGVASARDSSSAEVMMKQHGELKAKMDGRRKTIQQCVELGKILLAAGNPASEEVSITYNLTYISIQQNHITLNLYAAKPHITLYGSKLHFTSHFMYQNLITHRTHLAQNVLRTICFLELGDSVVVLCFLLLHTTIAQLSGNGAG